MSSRQSIYGRLLGVHCLLIALCISAGGCKDEDSRTVQSATLRDSGPILSREHDGKLHFDERYLDSQNVRPQNARMQRQFAIQTQLYRLNLAKRAASQPPNSYGPPPTSDSVFESANGGKLRGWVNNRAQLVDIYRKIDSLKKLQHLPITPH